MVPLLVVLLLTSRGGVNAWFLPRTPSSHRSRLSLIKNEDDNDNVSASSRARREEDRRRKERQEDVVIGKTSAIPNAKDFTLDPKRTELEYLNQASDLEKVVHRETERGMQALMNFNVENANDAFDSIFQLKPDAYIWQAGIAKFYSNHTKQAAKVFDRCANIYEQRFGQVATEERIWHNACLIQLLQNENEETSPLLQELQTKGADDDLEPENRKVFRIAHDLFSSTVLDDNSKMVLARAKLRAICGDNLDKMDYKLWRVSAWYYLGLHYDVMGQHSLSQECMEAALLQTKPRSLNDMLVVLPALHKAQRKWNSNEGQDSLVLESIEKGVGTLDSKDIQEALRARGIPVGQASKEELREILFKSLIDDAGLGQDL